jgi:hypothetical protein
MAYEQRGERNFGGQGGGGDGGFDGGGGGFGRGRGKRECRFSRSYSKVHIIILPSLARWSWRC